MLTDEENSRYQKFGWLIMATNTLLQGDKAPNMVLEAECFIVEVSKHFQINQNLGEQYANK